MGAAPTDLSQTVGVPQRPPSPAERAAQSHLLRQLTRAGVPSSEQIVAELRQVILAGGAVPGTAIPVDEVADLFTVSRIPVREALKTLVGEGLLEHRPRAGYTVTSLTRAELEEFYVVRRVLENAALAAAVGRAGAEHDDEVRAALAELDGMAEDGPGYQQGSRRFHTALVSSSRMFRLLAMLESAWNLTEPFQLMRHTPPQTRRSLQDDHREMADAFTARDADRLLAAAERHSLTLEGIVAGLPPTDGLADGPARGSASGVPPSGDHRGGSFAAR